MRQYSEDRVAQLATQYQEALLAGKRDQAIRLVNTALDNGLPVPSLYLGVLQPVQHRIGDLWQSNLISVAVEHYSTAVTQLVMSQIFPRIMGDGSAGKTIVGCCASGELHELGVRMVCDFFEMHNWTTHFLGSNMPEEDLIAFLDNNRPDLICISCTTTYNLHRVKRIIDATRTTFSSHCPAILVGGAPFIAAPDLVTKVKADGTAADAADAVRLGKELVA